MTEQQRETLSVLFLCTGNSARSQIAEALLATRGAGRFVAGSAGVNPRPAVHPDAIAVLAEHGIDWSSARPKTVEDTGRNKWDFVITVCDRAKESCPFIPGQPVFAHWGMPDPADIADSDARRRAFSNTLQVLRARIDLLLAIPFDKLAHNARTSRVQEIGDTGVASR